MKRIIRLTENDLDRIVKRVVKEEMDEYQRRELEDLHDDLLYLTPSYGGRNLGNAISIYREMKSIVGDSEVSEKAERLMSKIDNEISGLEGIHERIIQLYMELTGDNSFEEI